MTPTKKKTTPAAKKPPKKKLPVKKAPAKKKVVKKTVNKTTVDSVVEIELPQIETRSKKAKAVVAPSMKMYRRIAFGFVGVTIVMLAVVILLSTIKAAITIYPNVQEIRTEFIADVVKETELEGEIPGRVIDVTLDETREFVVAEDGATAVPAKAGGMVTIHNDSNRAQPLVSTTRLLTPEGILFRIDEGVTVPAGGSVETMAHADEEGQSGQVGPSTFTIPGLNSSRQKEVYAESTEAMTGGLEYIKMVSEQDLEQAFVTVQDDLFVQARADLLAEIPKTYAGETYFEEVLDQVASVEAGEEIDTYSVSVSVHVVGVFYDQNALLTIAEAKLYESLEKGYQLFDVDRADMQVDVERYDLEYELANVKVLLEGQTMVAPTNDLLNKDNLVGLRTKELSDYLMNSGVAVNVDISFFPFWISKVPSLKDRIEIKMQAPDSAL
jgi:hypothetical protein